MVQKKLQQSTAAAVNAKSSNVRRSKSIPNNLEEPTKKTVSIPKLRIKKELKKSQDKPKRGTLPLLKNVGKTPSAISSSSEESPLPSKRTKRNSSKQQNELAHSTVNTIGDSKQLKHRSQKCPSNAKGKTTNKDAENAKFIKNITTKANGQPVTKTSALPMSISRTPKFLDLSKNCENLLSSNGTMSIRQIEFSKTRSATFPTITNSTLDLNGDNDNTFKHPSSMMIQSAGLELRRHSTSINKIKPVIRQRTSAVYEDNSDVSLSKKSLHVSEVPKSLPGRESEFKDAYKFVESKILDESGG